jgi:hypothetical protein
LAAGLSGCAVEAGDETLSDSATGEVSQAITKANPSIDAVFVANVTLQSPKTATTEYTDIAVSSSNIYLARSDGRIEVRSSTGTFTAFTSTARGQKIEYISPGGWALLAANDSVRKIYKTAQGSSPVQLGEYPSGVTTLWAMTAAPSGSSLKLYIIHADSGGLGVLRVGTYDPINGFIDWESTLRSWGPYNRGIAHSSSSIYTVVDFTKSYFSWKSTSTFSNSHEATFLAQGWTDHAYHHSSGVDDTFAPVGLQYFPDNNSFYGIDRFFPDSSSFAWKIARIAKTSLKP